MDRRQQKTRKAIFEAFIDLLSTKHYDKITIGEIISKANVGRATFYAHFETKDFLLKDLCQDLFCHLFDCATNQHHNHLFNCEAPESTFLHLLQHLKNNDNNLLKLMCCPNNELFLRYFKQNLATLIENQPDLYVCCKCPNIPREFWLNHVVNTFVETVKWWLAHDMKQSAQQICTYFYAVL